MIFRDGIQLFTQPGALPEVGTRRSAQQVRELDMDEVRKQLGDHEHEHSADCNH